MLKLALRIAPVLMIGSMSVLIGCNENPTQPAPTSAASQGEEVAIPKEALQYTMSDYQEMFKRDVADIPALAKRSGDISVMDLKKLHSIHKKVETLYKVPNFNKIETEEQLRDVEKLLGMSRKEIAKNANKIRQERIAGRRYLLYKQIIAEFKGGLKPQPLAKTAYFFGLSDAEFWLLTYNPTFIDGTAQAKTDALAAESQYYGSNTARTRGDAYRHTIWNHMMADYNSHEVNYKSEAADWARKFANAHEEGGKASSGFYDYNYPAPASALETPMDYHNNARGREYFLSVSKNRGKLNWWGYDSRWVETIAVPTAKEQVYGKAQGAYQFTSAAQLPSYATSLVFIE